MVRTTLLWETLFTNSEQVREAEARVQRVSIV